MTKSKKIVIQPVKKTSTLKVKAFVKAGGFGAGNHSRTFIA